MYKKIVVLACIVIASGININAFVFINKSGKRVLVSQSNEVGYFTSSIPGVNNNGHVTLKPSASLTAAVEAIGSYKVAEPAGLTATLDLQQYTAEQLKSDAVIVTLNADFKLVVTGAVGQAENKRAGAGAGRGTATPQYLSSGAAGSRQSVSSQTSGVRLLPLPKAESAASAAAPARKTEVQQLHDDLRAAELEIDRLKKEIARLNKILGDVRSAVGVL